MSLPHRLTRLNGQRTTVDLERTVAELAVEYGLDPAEVRVELEHIEEHTRRFGPSSVEQAIRRCAAEVGLPEAELWTEYAQITGRAGARR